MTIPSTLTKPLTVKHPRFFALTMLALGALPLAGMASTSHFSESTKVTRDCSVKHQAVQRTPSDTLTIADPTIFPYGGKYYLIGTSGDHTVSSGFKAFESRDLIHWHRITSPNQPNYLILDSSNSFGNKGFWAPQLLLPPRSISAKSLNKNHKKSGAHKSVLMAYTANEQIAIAWSFDGVKGPFTQRTSNIATNTSQRFSKLFKDGFKHIDPFIFTDPATGKQFIYYVKLDKGNNIYVSELRVDHNGRLSVQKNTEKPCIRATKHWENTADAGWPVTEGPTVLYHNGYYYLFYSANDFRNVDYAVGYATSRSPVGPWIKSTESPVISRSLTGLNGTGHGDVFQNDKGQFYYVFHAHNGPHKVGPRKTFLIRFAFGPAKDANQPDKIQMDYSSVQPLLIKKDQ